MDKRKVEAARFEEALQATRQRFPALRIDVTREHPHVEALAEVPVQRGLDFEVSFNLQNRDELHLCASHFWVEWFPCGDQDLLRRRAVILQQYADDDNLWPEDQADVPGYEGAT